MQLLGSWAPRLLVDGIPRFLGIGSNGPADATECGSKYGSVLGGRSWSRSWDGIWDEVGTWRRDSLHPKPGNCRSSGRREPVTCDLGLGPPALSASTGGLPATLLQETAPMAPMAPMVVRCSQTQRTTRASLAPT